MSWSWWITGGINSPLAMATGSFFGLLLSIWYIKKTLEFADALDRFFKRGKP